MDPNDKHAVLEALLRRRILVLDGAMGTMIQALELARRTSAASASRDHPRDLKG